MERERGGLACLLSADPHTKAPCPILTSTLFYRYQTIPLSKIEDFGVHANQYYSLDITFFKSSLDSHMLDLLWNKYGRGSVEICVVQEQPDVHMLDLLWNKY